MFGFCLLADYINACWLQFAADNCIILIFIVIIFSAKKNDRYDVLSRRNAICDKLSVTLFLGVRFVDAVSYLLLSF